MSEPSRDVMAKLMAAHAEILERRGSDWLKYDRVQGDNIQADFRIAATYLRQAAAILRELEAGGWRLPEPMQYERYHGTVDEAERQRILTSKLYAAGDTVLVWVNEGSIIMVGREDFTPPITVGFSPPTTSDGGEG